MGQFFAGVVAGMVLMFLLIYFWVPVILKRAQQLLRKEAEDNDPNQRWRSGNFRLDDDIYS
jgi:predicted cobalt transporter CbtA